MRSAMLTALGVVFFSGGPAIAGIIVLFLSNYVEPGPRTALVLLFLITGVGLGFSVIGLSLDATTDRKTKTYALLYLAGIAATLIVCYANFFQIFGLEKKEDIASPLDYVYFSIVTWTTLGYGDLVPSKFSRLIAASEAILGYVFMGLYIALIFQRMLDTGKPERERTVVATPAPTSPPPNVRQSRPARARRGR